MPHHEAIEGVHFPHRGALGQAANTWVAAHLSNAGARSGRITDQMPVTSLQKNVSHHEAIKGVHFPHKGALGQAADAGIAAHFANAGPRRGRH